MTIVWRKCSASCSSVSGSSFNKFYHFVVAVAIIILIEINISISVINIVKDTRLLMLEMDKL